jgi:hypothetical protein
LSSPSPHATSDGQSHRDVSARNAAHATIPEMATAVTDTSTANTISRNMLILSSFVT